MMIRDKIFKLHRHRSSSSFSEKSGQRLDFSFSNLHARQVPKGWDKLSISLICVETGKTVSKSGKALVRNGNCKWTETWSQSIWITPDDISNQQEQFPFKFIVTMGSARSSILGEAALNPARYRDAKAYTPVSLPLKKCNYATVLQLEIKCLTALRGNEFKDMPIYIEEENVEYKNMEIKSEETGCRALSSSHSFASTEDSLGRESFSSLSDSNRPVNHIIGRQESIDSRSSASCSSYSFCESPKSYNSPYNLMNSGSGKNAQNQKDDYKQLSHDNTASVQLAASSRNSLQGKDITSKELIAEAMMWEQNAQSLKINLEMSRKEFFDQTQQIENLKMEHRSLGTERDGLMQEIKHLEVLLQESMEKEKATDSLMLQVRDMDSVQKILKGELRIQKESNDSMSLQLSKTQESNIELVSILQEMEETVENQKLEIENLHILNQQNLEDKLQQLQESQINLENTTLRLEKIIREKTHEIELEQGHRTQALLDCEEKWKIKSREQEEEIAYLKAELSRILSAESSETNKAKPAADCDLIRENETLKEKLQELERDCKELTEENLELLYELKSKGTSSISGPILSSSSVEGQLSEQSPGGSEFEVSNGELLSSPFQDDKGKKKIIAETAASESKQKICDQEENLAQVEFHSRVKDNASRLNAEIISRCFEVQEKDQRTEVAAIPLECHQEESCHGGFTHENVPAMFQSSESGRIEDVYALLTTLCHTTKDEQADAVLKKLLQLLGYRSALCLDGSNHIEEEPKITAKDACEVQDGEKDDLPEEKTPCSCCQRLEDSNKVLDIKVQNLSSDNLAKNSEILELKTDCLKKDAEIEALRHQQTDLRTQISDLQMSKCQMEERMENLQQELSDTSKSLDTSTNGLMFLDQCICGDVSKMTLKMKSLELESDKYELELNLYELEKDNVDLSERVSGLEAQLRHLSDAMEFNRLELQHSGNHVVNLQEKVRELEHEKESQKLDMKEKLLEMQKRWLDAQEECEYLKKVNPKLQATTESLMEECRLLQNLNAELRQQKLKLHTSHNVLEAELRKSQYSFSTCLKRIESLEANFSSVLEEIESKEKILKFKLDDLHLQTKEHREKLIVEECTLHEISLENTIEVEKLQEQVQSLMMRMSNLMSDLGTSKAKEGTLAANCEKLLRTMEHLASNEAKLKCTINELESKLLSSECQMLQMTEEKSSLKIQLHSLPLLQEEVLDLKGALSRMKFESERLQVTLQLKYEDCEELKAEKASLLQEISCMHMAVAEAEECKYKKISLEEKVLRLEGDLTAKEVMCAKVSELKNEACQLRRVNSQFLRKIKSLQFEKEDCLKQVKSVEKEFKRKQLENQREDDVPALEELKLSKAEEEDFSKQFGITTQSPQPEKYLKQKIQGNSQQDGNKESNYNRDLQETVAKSVSAIQFPGDTVVQTLESNCIHESHLISLSSKGRDENVHKICQLEAELQEIRDRYLHMSVKYAEVEDQREQLVMTLKAMHDQKTARGSYLSSFWSAGADI
ncbi:putative WEB family protein At1g65010, chloroplastic [Nicotiana sylvestris]|uniref:Cingulin-like isoform X1 n=2 Tax=Nicotiana sylvestris TaxID=4096 RepID=A0A1U7XL24_NICSY|nr:PREDICTED: cingulin-like isoform X1 [Nicotiana sylvestris]